MRNLTYFVTAAMFLYSHQGMAACSSIDTYLWKIRNAIDQAKTNCLNSGQNADYVDSSSGTTQTRYCILEENAKTVSYTAAGATKTVDTKWWAKLYAKGEMNEDMTKDKKEIFLRFKKVSTGVYNFQFVIVAGKSDVETGMFFCRGILDDNNSVNVELDCGYPNDTVHTYRKAGGVTSCY